MNVPGVCIVCRRPVLWNGRFWKRPGRGSGTRHACPTERPTCGAVMPGRGNWRRSDGSTGPRERCARQPGHGYEHRTAYSMANANRMATGRGL